MNPFLRQVAKYLYVNNIPEISDYCIVFPGRRAGIFFTAYLNELISSPIISPEIITINELITSLTGLSQTDSISLIMKLHEVYTEETGHVETIDEFYFWGEILLSDFDDVDKYLVDAEDLFRNINDLKELDYLFDYLTIEQKKAIEEFWGNIEKVPHSFNKEKFLSVWVKLFQIYKQFKIKSKAEQIAYQGMIYRDVTENLSNYSTKLNAKKYVFVGFNALNNCEKDLFKYLAKQNKALFFWDYDSAYLNDSNKLAGRFIRTNILNFSPPKDFTPENFDENKKRKITFISVSGNKTQAQAVNIPNISGQLVSNNRFDNSAFVLADENLLIPVISSIGNKFEDINITMGYQFTNTPVYGFISQVINLQRNVRRSRETVQFYYKQVISILNHQYIISNEIKEFVSLINKKNKIYIDRKELELNDFISLIFSCPDNSFEILDYLLLLIKELSKNFETGSTGNLKLESEYVYQAYLNIQKLRDTLYKLKLEKFPNKVLFRLIDQSLRSISIPFEGEPLKGLQVMGLLETRCLDFKNLVIFSANEGNLPKLSNSNSFIPYNIRKGFGMPTYEDKDAMYAYYFYRMIQRTENTIIVYNSINEGISSSEKSRFIYQLMYDSDFEIEEINLNYNFSGYKKEPVFVNSNLEHLDKLRIYFHDRNLSPSAINTYLDCKLKFYFKYIALIKEKDELKEEIDPVLFGNLFHFAMEQLYKPFVGKTISKSDLKSLISEPKKIEEVVRQTFAVVYFKLNPEDLHNVVFSGQLILIASHLTEYISQLINNDVKIAPFQLISLEQKYSDKYLIKSDNEEISIKVGGIVDRIDKVDGKFRIVDYKTGRNLKLDFKEIDELTDRSKNDRRKEIFQLLIYSDIISRNDNETNIFPAIYKLDNLFDKDFDPYIKHSGDKLIYKNVKQNFEINFMNLLAEIFSSTNIYDQTTDTAKCGYCPYNKICRN